MSCKHTLWRIIYRNYSVLKAILSCCYKMNEERFLPLIITIVKPTRSDNLKISR